MEQLPVPSQPPLPVAPPTLPPPAPTGRDPHPGLVVALPLLALGLFSSGATTWFGKDAGDAAKTHATPLPVSAVAVAAGGRTLTVTIPVRCATPPTATTAETPTRVTVTVRPPTTGRCTQAPTRVAVTLRRDLDHRTVVDAATGHPLPPT